MSSPELFPRAVILDQLDQDAPQSALLGPLRTLLKLSDDAAPPSLACLSSGSSTSTKPSPSSTPCVDPERVDLAAAYLSQQSKVEAGVRATLTGTSSEHQSEGTRVETLAHQPIFADFWNSSALPSLEALEIRETPVTAVHTGAETNLDSNYTSGRPESYVLVHNVAKRHNLGTLARSATAFGVTELVLVGRKDFNAFGSHGASLHMQFRHFHTLPEAALYLKSKNVDICGVEIVEGAIKVHKHPFTRSTAFVIGNEGTGFEERAREGHKFVVGERPVRRTRRNVVENPAAVTERRRQRANTGADDWLLCDGVEEQESDEAIKGMDANIIEFPACWWGS